jgi:hypothetical protein
VVPQHCDLLEDVIKATHEELDVLEIWWGGDVLLVMGVVAQCTSWRTLFTS